MVLVRADGRGKLEQIRKLHPALVRDLEAMHEANLTAKAKAWEERTAREAERAITAETADMSAVDSSNLASDAPSVTDEPNYTRASDRQILRERQAAAVRRLPDQPVEDVQSIAQNIVEPSYERGRTNNRGMELARRLRKLWHPDPPGSGSWMNRR